MIGIVLVGHARLAQELAETEGEVGPQRAVAAVSIDIPARTTAGHPDGTRHPPL